MVPREEIESPSPAYQADALPLSYRGMEGAVRFELTYRQLRRLVARSDWPHAPEWYPRENSNPDLHVRSVVSYPLNDGGKTLVVVQRIELCRAP